MNTASFSLDVWYAADELKTLISRLSDPTGEVNGKRFESVKGRQYQYKSVYSPDGSSRLAVECFSLKFEPTLWCLRFNCTYVHQGSIDPCYSLHQNLFIRNPPE
ncbi:hypothetical protein PM082_024053 [Marasmius tenuissimus]|nr:hypothetical protein PM082_024053 [Marasmius tenuissimus]